MAVKTPPRSQSLDYFFSRGAGVEGGNPHRMYGGLHPPPCPHGSYRKMMDGSGKGWAEAHNVPHFERFDDAVRGEYVETGKVPHAEARVSPLEQALLRGTVEDVIHEAEAHTLREGRHSGTGRDAGRLLGWMRKAGVERLEARLVIEACQRLARSGFENLYDIEDETERRAMKAVYLWIRRERCDVGWCDYLLFAALVALCATFIIKGWRTTW